MTMLRPLGFLVLALLASAAAAQQQQPWSFVQAAGGLRLGKPVPRPTGWMLPVDADVSGLSTITTQPTAVHPALVCRETRATLEGQALYLTLITGTSGTGGTPRCAPVFISNALAGRYTVFYRFAGEPPVRLGEVLLSK
ncbi:MAG: hypothetical protein WA174_12515 [Rhodoferax sp.]